MATVRNSEGYYDPTAYEAMKNVEKEERMNKIMSIMKGDIYYIEYFRTSGSEQRPARPAIVVSNDMNNNVCGVVEVVYLTTQPKKDLPTHVTVRSTGKTSTALCEQITSVSIDRLETYIASCTEDEMMNIDIALMISLGISTPKAKSTETRTSEEALKDAKELEKAKQVAKDLGDENKELKALLSVAEQKTKAIESSYVSAESQQNITQKAAEFKAKYELMRELYAEAMKEAEFNV